MFWKTSRILANATQGLKMYAFVLFSNSFVQLLSSSFGSLFLVFPCRRLFITLDIQTDLKMKQTIQKHIQNAVKYPR